MKRISLLICILFAPISFLMALPQGGTVISGSGTIALDPQDSTRLIITQSSRRLLIEWSSFDIAAGETVEVVKDHSDLQNLTLNRVVSPVQASMVLGNLTATSGKVILINNRGMVFGARSQVNLTSLVATTSELTNTNFEAETWNFYRNAADVDQGSVINHAQITTELGGLIALLAPQVVNTGILLADQGRVDLASANDFSFETLNLNLTTLRAKPAISATVNGQATFVNLGLASNDALVVNRGEIRADVGAISLQARPIMNTTFTGPGQDQSNNAILSTGLLQSQSVGTSNSGSILLDGYYWGNVITDGTLDASGTGTDSTGGNITVLGQYVYLNDHTSIDISGDSAGGTAWIGGDGTISSNHYLSRQTTIGKDVLFNEEAPSGNHGTVNLTGYVEQRIGDIPLIFFAGHGGTLFPSWIPDRNCSSWTEGGAKCVVGSDTNTISLTKYTSSYIADLGFNKPHTIINHLSRYKLDPNRKLELAAMGDSWAELAWNNVMQGIENAEARATSRWGSGLFVDVHGTGQANDVVEFDYGMLPEDYLRPHGEFNGDLSFVDNVSGDWILLPEASSMHNLSLNHPLGLSPRQLILGHNSLPALLYRSGYRQVIVNADSYFPDYSLVDNYSGGYLTRRHGSSIFDRKESVEATQDPIGDRIANQGTVDSVQIESSWTIRNDVDRRKDFALQTGNVFQQFLSYHHDINLNTLPPEPAPSYGGTVLSHSTHAQDQTLPSTFSGLTPSTLAAWVADLNAWKFSYTDQSVNGETASGSLGTDPIDYLEQIYFALQDVRHQLSTIDGFVEWDDISYTRTVNDPAPSVESNLILSELAPAPLGWTQVGYEDFESGYGSYVDGGSDAILYTGSRAHQGNKAVNLQDDTSSSAIWTKTPIDVTGNDRIKIDFWYYAYSMESGEEFYVDYWDGSAWNTIRNYAHGSHFYNNTFYPASVLIDSNDYAFPSDMKIRFRANASSDADDIYLDEIIVSVQ